MQYITSSRIVIASNELKIWNIYPQFKLRIEHKSNKAAMLGIKEYAGSIFPEIEMSSLNFGLQNSEIGKPKTEVFAIFHSFVSMICSMQLLIIFFQCHVISTTKRKSSNVAAAISFFIFVKSLFISHTISFCRQWCKYFGKQDVILEVKHKFQDNARTKCLRSVSLHGSFLLHLRRKCRLFNSQFISEKSLLSCRFWMPREDTLWKVATEMNG